MPCSFALLFGCDVLVPVGTTHTPHTSDAGARDASPDSGVMDGSGLEDDASMRPDSGLDASSGTDIGSGDGAEIAVDGSDPADAGAGVDAIEGGADAIGGGDASGPDASRADAQGPDAAVADSGMSGFDGGCSGPGHASDGGPLPITNISIVPRSIHGTMDIADLASMPDPLSFDFQLELDNQTGGDEVVCVSEVIVSSAITGATATVAVTPGSFQLRPGRSTYRVDKVAGSLVTFDPMVLASFCGLPTHLDLSFSGGQMVGTVFLPTCIQ